MFVCICMVYCRAFAFLDDSDIILRRRFRGEVEVQLRGSYVYRRISKTNQCFDSQLDKKKFGRVRVPQYYSSHHTDILRKKLLIMKEVRLNILQNQINTVVSVY